MFRLNLLRAEINVSEKCFCFLIRTAGCYVFVKNAHVPEDEAEGLYNSISQ